MPKVLLNGEPGTSFTNDTGKVLFQLIVSWVHSCGQCIQYDHAVGSSFPIPFHRGCRCKQLLVAPGKAAQPFIDFRERIDELPPSERSKVVGASNLRLIERGLVEWKDVVTPTRVRDLREVVARAKLSVADMVKGGVREADARRAYESVHTPAHELAARTRADLVARVLAKGVEKDALRRALAGRLAGRVGIGAGPGGPGALPVKITTPRPSGGVASPRRISASPGGERLAPADVQRQYLGSLGVKAGAIERVAEPARASSEPILPGRPIAERIAAYADGHERVKRLQALGSDVARLEGQLAAQKLRAEEALRRWERATGAEKAAREQAKRHEESEASRLYLEHWQASKAARQAAQDVLETGRRFHLGADYARNLKDDQMDSVGEGLRWFQRNVAPPAEGAGRSPDAPMRIPIKPLPRGNDRAHCTDEEIRIGKAIDTPTVVHEVGHYLDYHAAGFDRSAREFLAHRIEGEIPRSLRETLGGHYRADEMGTSDRFGDAFGETSAWYVGKAYDDGMTEIVSMGLEQLYRDPVGFARKDPEYVTFLIGVMHGPLR